MNDLDKARVAQLRNYAQWERDHGGEKIHILDWAADEIERLHAEVAELEAGSEAVWYEHKSDSASIYAKPDFSKKQDFPTKDGRPLFYAPQPVKVPEGFISVPVELIHEYMELLGGAKYKAIHSMVRINACKAAIALNEDQN